MSESRMIESEK